jgi:hypothetical protein
MNRIPIYIISLMLTSIIGCIIWANDGQAPMNYQTVGITIMIGGVVWFLMCFYLESKIEKQADVIKDILRNYYLIKKEK